MVLQGPGDDLGGGRRTLVNEDHERNVRSDGTLARHVVLRRRSAAAHARDLPALRQEEVADGESLLQVAARIAAQIQHDAGRALAGEAPHRGGHLFRSRLVEPLQAHVAHAVVQLQGVGYCRNVDDGARELHLDRLWHALPRERHLHLGAGFTGECLGHPLGGPVARIERVVNLDDDVPFQNAARLGGCVREHLAHRHAAVGHHLDLHAEAAVASAGVLLELLELFRRVQLAVRVLQLLEETAGCLLVKRPGVHGVHETLGHQRENLVEQYGAVARHTVLIDEAPGDGGDQ